MKDKRQIYDADIPHRGVTVYLYLCDRANKEVSCFPAIKRIAADLHLSQSTVKRAITDLEQKGYITKENRFRDNGGKSSNKYFVV